MPTREIKNLIFQCLITGLILQIGVSNDDFEECKVTIISMSSYKRVVRLFFDVLHGIKRMDVPLILVVEFMVFLAYDGKLESDSDVEKELFSSAINQFKERSNIF